MSGYDLQKYGGRDEVLLIEPNKELTQAVFGQLRLSPELIPGTHLSAGFRYNHPDVGDQSIVWNTTGQYDFSESLFVRTTLGTNFRLPSAEELFANDPLDERGNPNLKPEKSRSIETSVGGQVPATWDTLPVGAHRLRPRYSRSHRYHSYRSRHRARHLW